MCCPVNRLPNSHITGNAFEFSRVSNIELANTNHLSVGDTLTLTHAKLGEADGAYIDEIPVKTAYIQVEVAKP